MSQFAYFRKLFPLLFLVFLDSLSYFMVIPVLLHLFFDPGIGLLPSETTQAFRQSLTGITISLSTFAAIISAPLMGTLSDQWGRKKVMLSCLGLMAIGFILPIIGIVSHQLFYVIAGRLIAGIGSSCQPVAQAAIADICQQFEEKLAVRQKAVFLGWASIAMTLSLIVGPALGGYLSDPAVATGFNPTTPYYAALVLVMLNAMLLWRFQETLVSQKIEGVLSVKNLILELPKVVRDYRLGIWLFTFFMMELGWSQYYNVVLLYLRSTYHYTVLQNSHFGTYLGICMALGLWFVYPSWIKKVSVFPCLQISLGGMLISLAACTLFPEASIQWIFGAIAAVFQGMVHISLLTLISQAVPTAQQGRVMGYTSTLLFSAWLLTAFFSGFLMSLLVLLPFALAALAIAASFYGVSRLKSFF